MSKMFKDKETSWSKNDVMSPIRSEDKSGDKVRLANIPNGSNHNIWTPESVNLEDFQQDMFVEWMNCIDVVMFDCDGVLWMGDKIFNNADLLVKKLRAMGKRVYFITNNSTKTREEFQKKFAILGFEPTFDEIIGTSHLAALYLTERNFQKKVYVIGTPGVTQELNAVGIRTLPIGPDIAEPEAIVGVHGESWFDPEVGAVVVGFDQHFSYNKMLKAATYLNNPDCIFIATNTDERFPSPTKSIIVPGTGSIVNAVKTAAEREPVVMGKPSKIPFEIIEKKMGLDPKRALMIGDRANTDILFGHVCKMYTLLVLSGVTKLSEVEEWRANGTTEQKKMIPNFYSNEVNDFYKKILDNNL